MLRRVLFVSLFLILAPAVLAKQHGAQGLGMRGDMVEAGQLVGTHMSRAQSALQNKDPKGARKYMDLADAQIAKIEKFLGR